MNNLTMQVCREHITLVLVKISVMVRFLETQFDCFGNRKVLLIDVIKKLHKMEKRLVYGKVEILVTERS